MFGAQGTTQPTCHPGLQSGDRSAGSPLQHASRKGSFYEDSSSSDIPDTICLIRSTDEQDVGLKIYDKINIAERAAFGSDCACLRKRLNLRMVPVVLIMLKAVFLWRKKMYDFEQCR